MQNNLECSSDPVTEFQDKVQHINNLQDSECIHFFQDSFYKKLDSNDKQYFCSWLRDYAKRIQSEQTSCSNRKTKMNSVNPHFILRNWIVQMAIEGAERGDFEIMNHLQEVIKNPFEKPTCPDEWLGKRPEWARNKAGCSMLSCSS